MNTFLKMVDFVNSNDIYNICLNEDGSKVDEYATKGPPTDHDNYAFINARPFVFSPLEDRVFRVEDEEPREIDAPFECFSIEMTDNAPIVLLGKTNEVSVRGIVVREYAPKRFDIYLWIYETDGLQFSNPKIVKSNSFSPVHARIVGDMLDRIQKEVMGFTYAGVRFKVGNGKLKRHGKIKRTIRVMPKNIANMIKKVSEEHIDFDHRFEVRGHWRRQPGVGKDRDGKYTVKNYTWVVNHTRGPEHLPVIKKTRVWAGHA